jgi:hypothetical protein
VLRANHTVAVAALFFAGACGGNPAYVHAEETTTIAVASALVPESAPARAVRENPFALGSTWYGTYSCPQGATDLEIHITATHGNVIDDALFDFKFAPRAVAGAFHMSGRFDPESGRAVFDAGDWTVRPDPNWYTVGMDGSVDARGKTYDGKIVADGCSAFHVTRR